MGAGYKFDSAVTKGHNRSQNTESGWGDDIHATKHDDSTDGKGCDTDTRSDGVGSKDRRKMRKARPS